MVGELDPHSHFLEPRVFEEMKVTTSGQFGGLGIEITKREDGFITIISPIYGTPAYKKGLLPGDRIVKIEGEELRDPDINEVVDKLRGEPGTKVTITIFRVGEPLFDVTITRERVKVPSVVDPHMVEDGIGYVKLVQFQERSAAELDKALRNLEKQGMSALILDLRDNPGGLFKTAVEICDLFIDANPEPRILVSTRGRESQHQEEMIARSHNEGTHPDYPIVVLVNGASASASEIVAGAMKDLGRGILIGTRTYGKGSVQTIIPLRDDMALSLTTARYYTPSGALIHGKGIEPDIDVPVTAKEELERRRQKLLRMEKNIKNGPDNGEATEESEGPKESGGDQSSEEAGSPDDELLKSLSAGQQEETGPKYSDRQLQRAIDVLKAIQVLRAGEFNLLKKTP
jgi:carboxyl-terminal processing protease